MYLPIGENIPTITFIIEPDNKESYALITLLLINSGIIESNITKETSDEINFVDKLNGNMLTITNRII